MYRSAVKSLSLSVALLLVVCGAWSQGTERADLVGVVLDSSGAAVPGAKLRLTNVATNVAADTVSQQDGGYSFRFLLPGKYTLKCEKDGFSTVSITGIAIQVSIGQNVTVTLKPSPVAETVTVSAQSHTIETTDATVKYSVGNDTIRSLPIFTSTQGRTLLDQLPYLVPGVVSSSPLGGGIRGENIVINGARPSSTAFYFEGGDNNDHEMNRAASPMPNPDAIQEFTVVTNNYRADVGRSSGGVIQAVAKSGSNTFHGNARYFLLNEAFNARGFFDPRRPRSRLNTPGAQLGGPLWIPKVYNGRERTFFFFDWEGNTSKRDVLYNRDLISQAERGGNFSAAVTRPRDPRTGQPFPGGLIPADRISPIAKTYLDRWIPAPNSGERFYRALIPSSDSGRQYTAKLDHKLSERDSIGGTYFFTIFEQDSGSTTNVPVPSKQNSNSENHNFTLRETHTFSPRTINQFNGTLTRYVNSLVFKTPGADGIAPSELGFTGVRPQTGIVLGPPTIVISGTGVQFSTGGGSASYRTAWQIRDDFSHTRGKHALKFGFETRGFIFNKYLPNNNGSFGFSTANSFGTGNAIADFLLGLPNSFSQSTGNIMYPRQKAYYFYGMDDWRVAPGLTINIGLRYELVPPLVDQRDQLSAYRPGVRSQRLPQAPLGVLFVGDPDPILGKVPRGAYPADANNFAPRFGLAWTPSVKGGWLRTLLGEGRTSIRAGWGVFFDQTYGFGFTQYSFTQPFSVSQSLAASQIYGAGGTFANPYGTLPNLWPLDLTERTFTGTPNQQPMDPTFRTAYTYQYNLTIQRQFGLGLLAEVAYVGSNSFKLNREQELNYALLGPGATTGNIQSRRINPALAQVYSQESTGRAYYNSLQTRLSRRLRQFSFDASYVLSRSIDNGSNPQNSQLAGTNPLRWARSSNDRSHNFVFSGTYETAIGGAGFRRRVMGGWGVGSSVQLRSGLPMDINQTGDTTLQARFIGGQGNPDVVGPYRKFDPRQYQSFVIAGVARPGNYFFDPTAFAPVVLPTDASIAYLSARPGNLGRNVFNGPGQNLVNMSVWKRTQVRERHELEIRADINSLFNHANFSFPGRTAGSATFGTISSFQTGSGRNVQLSARYTF
jgi:hypothetical protein